MFEIRTTFGSRKEENIRKIHIGTQLETYTQMGRGSR